MDASTPTYEQEIALADAVRDARAACDRARAAAAAGANGAAPSASAAADAAAALKEADVCLQRGRSLLKEFEQEARLDGILPSLLADRRRPLAEALVTAAAALRAARADVAGVAAGTASGSDTDRIAALEGRSVDSMTTPEMMLLGRSLIKETDAALARSARVVAETQAVGAKTAEALAGQTEQLERVLDDADALRESLKRGRGALLDVVRGAATDRCLASLLMLVVLAAVAALVVKLVVRKPAAAPAAGRRLFAAAVAAAAAARR